MTQTGEALEQPLFDIHDRCRKARETAGLTQEELANRIEVARQTISNYEARVVTRLRPIVLRQWAIACGVSPDWLIHGTETVGFPFGHPEQDFQGILPMSFPMALVA